MRKTEIDLGKQMCSVLNELKGRVETVGRREGKFVSLCFDQRIDTSDELNC